MNPHTPFFMVWIVILAALGLTAFVYSGYTFFLNPISDLGSSDYSICPLLFDIWLGIGGLYEIIKLNEEAKANR